MRRLSGLDASFLYMETPELPMHTIHVMRWDTSTMRGAHAFARVAELLAERLSLFPPLRRRIVRVPLDLHHPVWIDEPAFALERHIERVTVSAPGGCAELDALVGEIAATPLDPGRPLWELWVVDGLGGGETGLVWKLHHCLADGVAASQMLAGALSTCSTADPKRPEPAWRAGEVPTPFRLVRDALADSARQLVRMPPLVLRTITRLTAVLRDRASAAVKAPFPFSTPRESFNEPFARQRAFASTTLPLGDFRFVARCFACSINDVLMAVVAGALRTWLAEGGRPCERELVVGVPIAVDDGDASAHLSGNRLSNLCTLLRLDLASPIERLDAIRATTRAAKVAHDVLGEATYREWSEYARGFTQRLVWDTILPRLSRPPVNLVVSNLPGPPAPLYAAGARLTSLHLVGPLLRGIGLNITAWSYAGGMNLGLLASAQGVPDLRDLAVGLRIALDELSIRARADDLRPRRTSTGARVRTG